MISLKNVTKVYPSIKNREPSTALDNISFEIGEEEFVSLVGKSGAGKSTLFKLILGEERPTFGEVLFDGFNLTETKRKDLPKLRRKIGTVFQDYRLFPDKTAYENIAYVMEVMGAREEEIKRDVSQVLDIVGLSGKADNFPKQLSGGEKQRTAIARALITRPNIILADEPTGNLDPYHTNDIIRLLIKIYEFGTTVILATHDKEIINRLGKRVITLDNGRIKRDEERGRFIL